MLDACPLKWPSRPWAQRAYFLHAMRGGGLRSLAFWLSLASFSVVPRETQSVLCRARLHGEGPGQSLRHLLPLYRFLQRSLGTQQCPKLLWSSVCLSVTACSTSAYTRSVFHVNSSAFHAVHGTQVQLWRCPLLQLPQALACEVASAHAHAETRDDHLSLSFCLPWVASLQDKDLRIPITIIGHKLL